MGIKRNKTSERVKFIVFDTLVHASHYYIHIRTQWQFYPHTHSNKTPNQLKYEMRKKEKIAAQE